MIQGRKVLLIIGGGIAAYKCLDLIRRLAERGFDKKHTKTGTIYYGIGLKKGDG